MSFTQLIPAFVLANLIGVSDMQIISSAPWPMVGHDARHSFRSQLRGPRDATVLWTFTAQLEEVINCGTVIDRRGNVYFGTWGRYMSSDFTSVTALDDGSAFLVGTVHYNGGTAVGMRLRSGLWERVQCPATEDLNAVHAVGPQAGWAVGDSGTIMRLAGDGWESYESAPTSADLLGLDVDESGEAWAVGRGGTILKCDGARWQVSASPTSVDLHDVSLNADGEWGLACGGFWYVNLLELVDGSWQLVSSAQLGLRGTLRAVEVVDSRSAWVVGGYEGANGWVTEFAHVEDGDWSVYQVDQGPRLYSLAFTSPWQGWAVGEDELGRGIIWRYEAGSGWSAWEQVLETEPLHSVSCSPGAGTWAVGDKATILRFDGATWSRQQEDLYTYHSTDGKLFSIGRDGSERWHVDPGYIMGDEDQARAGTLESTPAIDSGRRRIYFGRGDGVVRAQNLDTHVEEWSLDTNEDETGFGQYSQIVAGITLDSEGNLHFVSCLPRLSFYSVRPDGTPLGQYDVGDKLQVVIGAPAIREDENGRMVFFAAANKLYAFDGFASPENLRWIYRARAAENLLLPTVSDDGETVYVTSQWPGSQGRVHAVNIEQHDANWIFNVQEETAGVVSLGHPDQGGYLYIGSGTGDGTGWPHLYVLEDLGSAYAYPFGEAASVLEFTDSAAVSSPLIDRDGDLFVVAGGRADETIDGPAVVLAYHADLTPKITPGGRRFEVVLDRPIMGLASLGLGPGRVLTIGDSACHEHDCADATNTPTLYAIGGR